MNKRNHFWNVIKSVLVKASVKFRYGAIVHQMLHVANSAQKLVEYNTNLDEA